MSALSKEANGVQTLHRLHMALAKDMDGFGGIPVAGNEGWG